MIFAGSLFKALLPETLIYMSPLKKLTFILVILSNSDLSGCYRSMLRGPFDKLRVTFDELRVTFDELRVTFDELRVTSNLLPLLPFLSGLIHKNNTTGT